MVNSPIPEGHSWTLDKESKSWIYGPVWIILTLPPASQSCTELGVAARARMAVVLGVHAKRQSVNVTSRHQL